MHLALNALRVQESQSMPMEPVAGTEAQILLEGLLACVEGILTDFRFQCQATGSIRCITAVFIARARNMKPNLTQPDCLMVELHRLLASQCGRDGSGSDAAAR